MARVSIRDLWGRLTQKKAMNPEMRNMREEEPDRDFSTFTPAEQIAETIIYLCSDDAASMNGQRVTLRGAY